MESGLTVEREKSTVKKTIRFCPCCAFDLDLTLPESEKLETTRRDDCDENESDSQALSPLPDIANTFNELVEASRNGNEGRDDERNLPVVIVDTHGHAQLNRERNEAYLLETLRSETSGNDEDEKLNLKQRTESFHVKSLACSVEPADFDTTLEYAARSDRILPALGVHPWYIENLPGFSSSLERNNKSEDVNPENTALDSEWLVRMEELLLEHPNCLVGEIGLCKIAKWVRNFPDGKSAAMEIQKEIFRKQMEIAAKLRRPVSVHCVNSHGIFVAAINELLERNLNEGDTTKMNGSRSTSDSSRRFLLPPAIAMHSFTGTAHHVKELLALEQSIDFPNSRTTRKKKRAPKKNTTTENDDTIPPPPPPKPPLFYFGFSHTVNYAMCTSDKARKKGKEAVQAVPLDRLLVESDVHSDMDVAGGTVGAISYVAWARNMHARDVMSATSKNGLAFLGSIRT